VLPPHLQPTEHAALSAVLSYWDSRWDWECTTLFGLELEEYRAAVDTWRATSDLALPQVAFAMLGALREFLYGASAVKSEAVANIAGMPKNDLVALENRIGPYVLAVVEQRRTA
jgi:hypothetical protein